MKPFLYVFCSIPTLPPPPRTLPLPPCFLFEWGYPCERPSFLVLFSPLLGRLSTSDALLFNPPLIPFTLSFTSLRAPRRRKRCLCSNYSRPWSDWATPPPTTTPQETATQGFFFFSVSSVSRVFNPEPQKVNGREVSSLWLLFVSPSSLLSRSIHLSLSPLFPPPVSYVCIPHSCGNKTKKKGPRITTRVWRCAAGASRPVQERMKHSSVVIINSCRYCETGTAATVLGELCSPYSCAPLTFQPVDVFYCGCHGGVAGTQYD